ncbi:GNAT family N-acetyltransferase [Desertihabitans brevis]|uniref:GNAT family N-acetyltransferase n=1 Tax=Desertihabitans brevis TaxID=2268447 RepID=UPI0011BDDC43|nr:GNAT family N-acetyltransferase [Desertihabitans brevis]
MTVPAEPWLSPAIEIRASDIAGRGLFAREPVAVGVRVARFGGRLVDDAELRALFASSSTYIDTISIDRDLNLVLPGRSDNGYGNHSCDPNLWWEPGLWLTARRRIAVDEEVTVDYGTITDDPDFSMPCSCGSHLCRGTVTGRDWAVPALQRRYGHHWIPGLLKKRRDVVPALRILEMTASDREGFAALVNDIHRAFGFSFDPDLDADLADPAAFYQHVWVLKDGDEVVGSAALTPPRERVMTLKRMYLHPSYRGQGWGRRLLATAIRAATAASCRAIRLDTSERQSAARRLYEAAGFELERVSNGTRYYVKHL